MSYYIQILTTRLSAHKYSMTTATITSVSLADAGGATTRINANTTTLAVPSSASAPNTHPPLKTTPSTSFPFLSLPGELRNTIYALLLTPALSASRHPSPHPPHHLTPSLLRVSHLLHTESAPFLYAHSFRAHSSLLTSFPHFADPARPLASRFYISLIRKWRISVRLDTDPNWSKGQVTEAFSGVEELVVDVWEASFGAAGVRVLEGFWGVRGVGRARVRGCVERGMRRWLERVMESEVGAEVVGWDGEDGEKKVVGEGHGVFQGN